MSAVGRAAMSMIEEVRRQFRDIPELKKALELMNLKDEKDWSDEDRNLYNDALTKADHDRCVKISTESAIREMVKPGLMAVITPVLIGYFFGPEALGGLLAGVTVSGVLVAIFNQMQVGLGTMLKK